MINYQKAVKISSKQTVWPAGCVIRLPETEVDETDLLKRISR